MQDELITFEDMFREAEAECRGDFAAARARLRSPRRLVMIGCRAAQNPDWWWANFHNVLNPELTHAQIGQLIHVSRANVTRYIRQIEITEEIYDELFNKKV